MASNSKLFIRKEKGGEGSIENTLREKGTALKTLSVSLISFHFNNHDL